MMHDVVHPTRRRWELLCVLFGHSWDSYEKESIEEWPYMISEANQCSHCLLAKRIILIPDPDGSPGVRKRRAY